MHSFVQIVFYFTFLLSNSDSNILYMCVPSFPCPLAHDLKRRGGAFSPSSLSPKIQSISSQRATA